ncbi:MAG: export ABC transporter ATP-binding protein [Planctomycetes bacterium]|nr:export ABC transporter ATP-binding protein [Planctomycetota bacterium]
MPTDAILTTRDLGKDFGDLKAVVGLDLDVPTGEFFGLLGPNGAGKTTAISMICGVVTPTRGTASVGGHDIRKDSSAARRLIGLAPQEYSLYEELSARQNLTFFGRLYGLNGSDLQQAGDRVLAIAGLTDRDREPVANFSGGMKRRLNLAVGLLHTPKVLICDEPTVGVDPQSRVHLFDALRELNDSGTTILYTSHYMEEVQELCGRIGIMDNGELVAHDTLDGLLASHGKESLEITVEGDVAAIAAALPDAEVEDDHLSLPPQDHLGDIVRTVEDLGGRIKNLEVRRSDLETVFLNLTGRHLRDS